MTAPQLPTNYNGSSPVDFVLRSGMNIPVADTAAWRPFSERNVNALISALNASALANELRAWMTFANLSIFTPFSLNGFNRSRHARLSWRTPAPAGAMEFPPVESIATVAMPGGYGDYESRLRFTIDVVISFKEHFGRSTPDREWKLSIQDLYRILGTLAATVADLTVAEQLGNIAGVDPLVVPPPRVLHLVTGPAITDLLNLDGLTLIPDAGRSHGAHLIADPSIDLRDPYERQTQIDNWLQQIALDAGILGMEELLEEYVSRSDLSV